MLICLMINHQNIKATNVASLCELTIFNYLCRWNKNLMMSLRNYQKSYRGEHTLMKLLNMHENSSRIFKKWTKLRLQKGSRRFRKNRKIFFLPKSMNIFSLYKNKIHSQLFTSILFPLNLGYHLNKILKTRKNKFF